LRRLAGVHRRQANHTKTKKFGYPSGVAKRPVRATRQIMAETQQIKHNWLSRLVGLQRRQAVFGKFSKTRENPKNNRDQRFTCNTYNIQLFNDRLKHTNSTPLTWIPCSSFIILESLRDQQ